MEIGLKVAPRLREPANRSHREEGGGIHATYVGALISQTQYVRRPSVTTAPTLGGPNVAVKYALAVAAVLYSLLLGLIRRFAGVLFGGAGGGNRHGGGEHSREGWLVSPNSASGKIRFRSRPVR